MTDPYSELEWLDATLDRWFDYQDLQDDYTWHGIEA